MQHLDASAPASGPVLGKAVFRAAQALGLTQADLSQVIGISPASVSRLVDGGYELSGKPFELAAYVVRLYRSLDASVHGDMDTMRAWMRNQNDHLHSVPRDEIKSIPGLVRVVAYLDAARAPV